MSGNWNWKAVWVRVGSILCDSGSCNLDLRIGISLSGAGRGGLWFRLSVR